LCFKGANTLNNKEEVMISQTATQQIFTTRQGFNQPNRDPVKLTALLYLKESLLKENYEECAEIVEIAREFGALPAEIRTILENPSGAIGFNARLRRK
jgi:hypothetical protein